MVRLPSLLLVVVIVLAAVGPAVAVTEGHPVLSVHLPDNRVEVGEPAQLDLFLLNDGEVTTGGPPAEENEVTTARNVTVALEAGDAPLAVETATRPVGSVPEGRVGPLPFVVTVDEDAAPGTYELPVTVSYTYTAEVDADDPDEPEYDVERETIERTVQVVVEDRATFAVQDVSADLAVGETGPLALQVRNDGGVDVTGATLTVASDDPALTFNGASSTSVFVGDWPAGENATATVTAGVAAGADVRPYPLSVSVTFRDADGDRRESDLDTAGAVPRVEQSFELVNVTSTLAVGAEGTIRGVLVNPGPAPVRNAVVVLSAENPNLVPVETEYAVGDLRPGETADFAFDAEVSDSADAGPRQLSIAVRYRDAGDDVRESDPLDARVEVGPRRPVFDVEPVSSALDAGETGVLELRVTNAGDEPVTDVSAKLFADDPLSSEDDEAFVDRLEPGTSATVRFGLTAAPDALDKRYPVSLDFQYDDAEGDTRLSDTYDVPVAVAAQEDGDGPSRTVLVAAGAVVLVVLSLAFWAWRRR